MFATGAPSISSNVLAGGKLQANINAQIDQINSSYFILWIPKNVAFHVNLAKLTPKVYYILSGCQVVA